MSMVNGGKSLKGLSSDVPKTISTGLFGMLLEHVYCRRSPGRSSIKDNEDPFRDNVHT
jgi:hypothetical protein